MQSRNVTSEVSATGVPNGWHTPYPTQQLRDLALKQNEMHKQGKGERVEENSHIDKAFASHEEGVRLLNRHNERNKYQPTT